MPTYVYECSACETTFEIDQRITEDALTTCRCGKEGSVKRIIQPIAVMFKGGGFYVNDTSPKAASEDAPAPAAAPTPASTPTPTPATPSE